ncbi:transposase [Streptomyces sp. Ag109_O5-10]|uniref:transposase n=1 Tax=Streptomyces sp. Ag109_O5-10 TaxID=1855349 RepID=UPI00352560CB
MKNYPPQFKADAVALYQSRPQATIRQVAADLGINPETSRNWVRAAGASRPRGRRARHATASWTSTTSPSRTTHPMARPVRQQPGFCWNRQPSATSYTSIPSSPSVARGIRPWSTRSGRTPARPHAAAGTRGMGEQMARLAAIRQGQARHQG